MTAQTETGLMFRIRETLVQSGHVMLWRSNTGFDRERRVKYGLGLGGADLVGLLRPSGRFAAFEVKTPLGRISREQSMWHTAVRNAGGFVAVVRSTDDAVLALHRALDGARE